MKKNNHTKKLELTANISKTFRKWRSRLVTERATPAILLSRSLDNDELIIISDVPKDITILALKCAIEALEKEEVISKDKF